MSHGNQLEKSLDYVPERSKKSKDLKQFSCTLESIIYIVKMSGISGNLHAFANKKILPLNILLVSICFQNHLTVFAPGVGFFSLLLILCELFNYMD